MLGVLFLDLGLKLEQYAILNVIWAVTILLFEIPSGAFADVIGRRLMVIVAAALMVGEMFVFAFAPVGVWLFPLLVINRVLSGMAEACASGADEALAYDSLPVAEIAVVAKLCSMLGALSAFSLARADRSFGVRVTWNISPINPASTPDHSE